MRVVICGGGVGGLTLAHALRSYGDVVVLDRDLEASATGGYRLHLDATACTILKDVLPSRAWETIRAVSDHPSTFQAFTVANDRLQPIVIDRQPPGEDRLLCNRVALRQLMAAPLGDQVRFGARIERVVLDGQGPQVVLSDGETIQADLVIGAEGPLSPTVTALAGAPTAHPTGLIGIAGSTLLTAGDEVPPFLLTGPGLALCGNGSGIFLSLTGLGRAHRALTPAQRHLTPPASLVWGLITRAAAVPDQVPTTGEDLTGVAVECLDGWDPRLSALVSRADPTSVARYTFRAADPRADLTPWASGLVTAIGDAVHCMPPTGGRAAATAIRDAGHLAAALGSRPSTPEGARAAIHEYEQAMPTWAVPALRESLRPVALINALARPGLAAIATPALRVAGRTGTAWHRGRS